MSVPVEPRTRDRVVRGLAMLAIALVSTLWLRTLDRVTEAPRLDSLTGLPTRIEPFSKYSTAALEFAAGSMPAERLVDFSPAYLALHRLVLTAEPEDASQRALAVEWLQTILVALAAAGLWWLLRRRFRRWWIAWCGVLAFLLSPGVVIYAPILEPEAVMVFLVVALLVTVEQAVATARASGWWALAAGVLCATAIATRPTLLPALVFVPLWLVLGERQKVGHERAGEGDVFSGVDSRSIRPVGWGVVHTGLFLLAPVLLLAALTVRNQRAIGEWTPTVMNPGTVFYEGNNPVSWGRSGSYPLAVEEIESELLDPALGATVDHPHVSYRAIARATAGEALTVSEVNRFWRQKGLAFVREHPLRWLRIELYKAAAIARRLAFHDVYEAEIRERALPFPLLPIPFLIVSAAVGLPTALQRWRSWFLILLLAAVQVAAMLAFYVSERQRLTLLPLVVLLAALGWQQLARADRRRRWLALIAIVVVTLALWPVDARLADAEWSVRAGHAASTRSRLAQFHRDAGETQAASLETVLAAHIAPALVDQVRPAGVPVSDGSLAAAALAVGPFDLRDPSRRFDRAVLAALSGRGPEARAFFEELEGSSFEFSRGARLSSQPAVWLARLALLAGDRSGAEAKLREALTASPGEPYVLGLLAATGDAGREAELYRLFDRASADLVLGTALCQLADGPLGDEETRRRGQELLVRVTDALPALRRARARLALCFNDQPTAGQQIWASSNELAVEPVPGDDRVLALYQNVGPSSAPAARLQAAQVARQFGRPRRALELLSDSRGVEAAGLTSVWQSEAERSQDLLTAAPTNAPTLRQDNP